MQNSVDKEDRDVYKFERDLQPHEPLVVLNRPNDDIDKPWIRFLYLALRIETNRSVTKSDVNFCRLSESFWGL